MFHQMVIKFFGHDDCQFMPTQITLIYLQSNGMVDGQRFTRAEQTLIIRAMRGTDSPDLQAR